MKHHKIIAAVPFLLIAACIISVLTVAVRVESDTAAAAAAAEKPLIVIDPGHGGMDGGASSESGLLEKDINLAISLSLRDLLRISGFSVVMTRETDCSIHDAGAATVRQMKVTDIHNRLKIMQEHPGCIFISVHQNHFTQSKYWGAQFFYSTAKDSSKALAEQLRLAFRSQLQPENTRELKPSGSEIYLMQHADTTAVLAECGFLSNAEEAAQLGSADYQKKVAFALFCGIFNFAAG
ncbi:MAG: N-acetylmuramoyl-L-alanine amidase [Firmicutes bacterium]|nr:N-acetylmuramoyl-L-alanine amidase [Bacillota bacterium]